MSLIPAFKKDKKLLAEMDSLLADRETLHIWWLGQSGFLVQWDGRRVLFDPYLSDSLTKKYAATDKPHTRISERVIDPELLTGLEIITSSHNHTDHLDAETLLPILKNNPQAKFFIPEANRKFVAERLGCDENFPSGLGFPDWKIWESLRPGLSFPGYIHGIPAKHNEIERDKNGHPKFMGFVVELGNFKIYHSGDTLWFDELVEILRPFKIDVALLPINGNDPARRVAGNLNCEEAAGLGKEIGAKIVVPCHYDMFEFNTADVRGFVREAEKIGQGYRVLRGGERFSF